MSRLEQLFDLLKKQVADVSPETPIDIGPPDGA